MSNLDYLFIFWFSSLSSTCPLLTRPLLSGHRVLFPGRGGSAPPVHPAARGCGGHSGLVPLPRPHLLPSADDGGGPVPLGGPESPQKLHPRDRVQGGLNMRPPPPQRAGGETGCKLNKQDTITRYHRLTGRNTLNLLAANHHKCSYNRVYTLCLCFHVLFSLNFYLKKHVCFFNTVC